MSIAAPPSRASSFPRWSATRPNRARRCGGELSYAEVGARLGQLGQVFESSGLTPGDSIAQLSPNCVEAALVQLAAWGFGLRYVPLHPLGSVDDHLFILNDSDIQALVVHPSKLQTHAPLLKAERLTRVFCHGLAEGTTDLRRLRSSFAPARLEAPDDPEAVVAVLYTGGTTGRSKGVTLTSAQMVLNVLLTLSGWEWPEEIRFLCSTPITHATGCMLVPILDRGGSIYLEPGFDAERFLDLVERHRITATFLVPTMIYKLTQTQQSRPRNVSSLESIIYGAAPPGGPAQRGARHLRPSSHPDLFAVRSSLLRRRAAKGRTPRRWRPAADELWSTHGRRRRRGARRRRQTNTGRRGGRDLPARAFDHAGLL